MAALLLAIPLLTSWILVRRVGHPALEVARPDAAPRRRQPAPETRSAKSPGERAVVNYCSVPSWTRRRIVLDQARGRRRRPCRPRRRAWDSYYKDASRRRRAAGGGHSLRLEKRRRRLRERIGIGISALRGRRDDAGLLPRPRCAERASASASARNAAARCDSRFFSSSGSSAIVRPSAGHQEQRIVAEAQIAPRLRRGSRPRSRRCGPARRPRAGSTNAATQRNARRRRAAGTSRSASSSLALLRASSDGKPGVARRIDARRAVQRVDLQPRIVRDRGQAGRARRPGAPWRSALSSNVSPSSRSSQSGATSSMVASVESPAPRAAGRSRAACRGCGSPDDLQRRARSSASRWRANSVCIAARGQPHQRRVLLGRERVLLGRRLHLDEPAVAGHHEVAVDLGLRILDVRQVDARLAVDDARRRSPRSAAGSDRPRSCPPAPAAAPPAPAPPTRR